MIFRFGFLLMRDQGLFLGPGGSGLEILRFVAAAVCYSQSHLCLSITSLKAVYACCLFCKPTIIFLISMLKRVG